MQLQFIVRYSISFTINAKIYLLQGPKLMTELGESDELRKFFYFSLLEFIFTLENKSPLRNGIKR